MLAYDFLDRPYPVIGWCAETKDDETILYPLVLNAGRVERLADGAVQFRVVGLGPAWVNAVNANNARVGPMPPLGQRELGG